MKKNVRRNIGLFAGIAAIVLIFTALFVPANLITGSTIFAHGHINIMLALSGVLFGITAIIISMPNRPFVDKQGPQREGIRVLTAAAA